MMTLIPSNLEMAWRAIDVEKGGIRIIISFRNDGIKDDEAEVIETYVRRPRGEDYLLPSYKGNYTYLA